MRSHCANEGPVVRPGGSGGLAKAEAQVPGDLPRPLPRTDQGGAGMKIATGWPGPEQPHDHHWRETSTEADRAAGLRHYVCDCTARRTVRGQSEVPA